ncbi:hypothetical protein DOY81_011120, partial [Sarcophaga bullata]
STMGPINPHVHEMAPVPWTPPHKFTEVFTFQSGTRINAKPIPTKEMMTEAIKTLSKGRPYRGFSFLGLRKYIFDNFLHSKRELIRRMVFVKKFFKEALETGQLQNVKGNGLNGSFRVPPSSPFRKMEKKVKPTPNNLKSLLGRKAKKVTRKVNPKVYKKAKKRPAPKPRKSVNLRKRKQPRRLNRRYSAKSK